MENNKKSFLLYLGQKDLINAVSNEQAGILLKSIYEYESTNILPDLDGVIKIAFLSIKEHLDIDREKYMNIVNRNKANGLKGGRPPKKENPKNPVGYLETQENPKKPKKADNDNDNDNVNVKYYKKILLNNTYININENKPINNSIIDWLDYKNEIKDKYTEVGLKTLIKKIDNSITTCGEQKVIDLIETSIANGYKGIIFDKLNNSQSNSNQKPTSTLKQIGRNGFQL